MAAANVNDKIAPRLTGVVLMGYGANSRIHMAKIVALSCDLPVLVEIVDSEEYIAKILPYLDEVVQDGLIVIDDVEIIKYGKTTPQR